MSDHSSPSVELADVHLELSSAAGPVNILRGIDLAVHPGEMVSVVGPSGSGKSTMMMIIGGLERPTSGTVSVAGHDLGTMDEDALALFRRRHVGIVFQNFHLVPTMTALENTALPLELAGDGQAFDKAREGLEAVGLGHRTTHYPGQLSGGEQQRAALARAFAGAPDLVLADEPTGNLDGDTGAQVIDLMFRLSRERDATLILITHDPALAGRCDRTVKLLDGRIVDDGLAGAGAPARVRAAE
jgi:putative ABC transport system ATP-binding protein